MTKRNMMMRLLSTILFTLLLASCAEKKTTGAGFKVTLGAAALSPTNANGGLVLWGRNTTNQDQFAKVLTPPYSNLNLELNNGNWTFAAVSWHKPTGNTLNLSGEVKCAVTSTAVQGVDVNISLDLNNENCTNSYFGPAGFTVGSSPKNFAPIKFFACGHLNEIDSDGDGIVQTVAAGNCLSPYDTAQMYDETDTKVQIKPYYKIKVLEYQKLGANAPNYSANSISTACLGGNNGYTNTFTGALKHVWAMAEVSSGVDTVNLPWGGGGAGIATQVETFFDNTCTEPFNQSIYLNGLAQSIRSNIDKAIALNAGVGYVYMATNQIGSGYSPFYSILPSLRCFQCSGGSCNSTEVSCLPYQSMPGKYQGELYINSSSFNVSIPAPEGATGCTYSVNTGWNSVYLNGMSTPTASFSSNICTVSFAASGYNGVANSWTDGFPTVTINWSGAGGTQTYIFNVMGNSNANDVRTLVNAKKVAHELIGYGKAFDYQLAPRLQMTTSGGPNDYNGIIQSLAETLMPNELGGFLGRKYKTCSELLNRRGGVPDYFTMQKESETINIRAEYKLGEVNRAAYQGAGTGTFPLRVEIFFNNQPNVIIETDCTQTINPTYYFEEKFSETKTESNIEFIDAKHRKYVIRAQNKNLAGEDFNTPKGHVEVDMIEIFNKSEYHLINNEYNMMEKINFVAKAKLDKSTTTTPANHPVLSIKSSESMRSTRKSGGSFNHNWIAQRMAIAIIPNGDGDFNLSADRLDDYVTDNNDTFPNSFTAPREGECDLLPAIGQQNCEIGSSGTWDNEDLSRHVATNYTAGIFRLDMCPNGAEFSSAGSCTELNTHDSEYVGNTFLGSSSFKYNISNPIPFDLNFLTTDDETDSSSFETYFFPSFN
jgi:hypothetical protein